MTQAVGPASQDLIPSQNNEFTHANISKKLVYELDTSEVN